MILRALRKNAADIAILLFCILLHAWMFSHRYISGAAIMSGDTQVLWSAEYLTLHSIREFNEFAWWDPTGLNGWPIHYAMLSGAYNYLNPFQFVALVIFKALSLVWSFDINTWLVVQKTVYYFILNLAGVFLITRETIRSRAARFFVLLAFTLCEIQFHGFRDAFMFAALPAALFLLYALIRYSRRQNPGNLVLLTTLSAVFLSGLCYGVALASFYWITLFAFFLLLFRPALIPRTIGIVRRVAAVPHGLLLVAAAILLPVSALTAALAPVLLDGGNLIRVAGSHPISYDVVTDWTGPDFGAPFYEMWSNVMAWIPFPDVHASRLHFDQWNAGLDHRYIGLATLPLIAIALAYRFSNRLVASFVLTIFVCNAVIVYTYKNLAFRGLMEGLAFFQNVRTMPGLLPRDGPSLFMILLAGIGLDILLTRSRRDRLARPAIRTIVSGGLAALLVVAALCIVLTFLPAFADIRHSLSHIGVYLGLYTFICLLLLATRHRASRRVLGTVLLVLVFTDLTVSAAFYWDRGLVWTRAGAVPQHRMPRPYAIGPITNEAQGWLGTYSGQFHNIFSSPFYGKREWLMLALDPRLLPMLENWNPQTRKMTAYPSFTFATGGTFVSFSRIHSINTVPVPTPDSAFGPIYVHDAVLRQPATFKREVLEAEWSVTEFTLNRQKVRVTMPQDGLMMSLDNYHPYWSARIDGRPAPIYRANFTFKAVQVPAGTHEIEWVFNPYPVKLAWVFFYLSLAAFLSLAWITRRSWTESNHVVPADNGTVS